jgi:CarD family transcriptional regulator
MQARKQVEVKVPAGPRAVPAAAVPTAVKAALKSPPRTPEFKVGDKAVYPARGVAEVVSIEEKDIAGNRQRFYVLRLMDTDHKIMVPVGNAVNIGLRKPISDKEIKEIYRILKVKEIQFDNQTWNRRSRGFMDKIKTGSVFEVAEVLRDLSRLKGSKALSFGERQMLEKARGLIVKEIAVARGKSEDKVRSEIDSIFDVS